MPVFEISRADFYRVISVQMDNYQMHLKMTPTHPVNDVYQNLLLNENKSNLVLVARQILLVRSILDP